MKRIKITTEEVNAGVHRVYVDAVYTGRISKKGSYYRPFIVEGSVIHPGSNRIKTRSLVEAVAKLQAIADN